ncbi:MAG: hypothetical protein CL624_09280 [Arcobacter sp.]|nr:hypothetical protein [Arcobacter sp.]|tara:strand:+ start:13959 stop:14381 length:423 start_codon:yes stop_codon:yes gene_type:complete
MRKLNILIVDDIEDNIYSLKLLIEDSFNCNFYEATNAMEGLNIIMDKKIDIVFSDVQMPGIDGFEFLSYLKSLKVTEDIPVILVSGINLSKKIVNKISKNEVEDFLSKPIDYDKLISSINKIVNERNLYDTNEIGNRLIS